jgi:predicted RNA-binding Zn-ribbon protein involved in translation (DUF1610 family)
VSDKARKEKVCQEEMCSDQWEALPAEVNTQCTTFVFCPFCANEMVTRCSVCNETIHDFGFRYCPWCGADFGE